MTAGRGTVSAAQDGMGKLRYVQEYQQRAPIPNYSAPAWLTLTKCGSSVDVILVDTANVPADESTQQTVRQLSAWAQTGWPQDEVNQLKADAPI
jgi:hypothetical protein